MIIGEVARSTGLSSKTIRYYEDIGLVARAARAPNGYREYRKVDVHRLNFIHRARSLGFTVDECRELLSLYDDHERHSADVKAIALARIDDVDRRIIGLESLKRTLTVLTENCHGDYRPECPILDDLASPVAS